MHSTVKVQQVPQALLVQRALREQPVLPAQLEQQVQQVQPAQRAPLALLVLPAQRVQPALLVQLVQTGFIAGIQTEMA
jgi:hypothetical protein